MAIFANAPAAATLTSSGATTAQTVQASAGGNLLLNIPAAGIVAGKPFYVVIQGYLNSHGASQTVNVTLAGATTAGGSLSAVGALGASSALTASTIYPFMLEAELFGDASSQVLSGMFWGAFGSGASPGLTKTQAATTQLTGVTFGSPSWVSPITGINTPSSAIVSVQFAPQITWSVADTVSTAVITSFYACAD